MRCSQASWVLLLATLLLASPDVSSAKLRATGAAVEPPRVTRDVRPAVTELVRSRPSAAGLPIETREQQVRVLIVNGFARTEVTQVYFNPNDVDLQAVYSFPVPKSASLSEMRMWVGDKVLSGEVLEKQKAQKVYEEERDKGNDAGTASKDEHRTFEFAVSPVRARQEARFQFVYYQPLTIDTEIARYQFPVEPGGNEQASERFWAPNARPPARSTYEVEIRSAWPIADVRVPDLESRCAVTRRSDGELTVKVDAADVSRDFVLYYRLKDDLPGRVEVVAHRRDRSADGTFMAILTPGIDLGSLEGRGADHVFVLDNSGSMTQSLPIVVQGVTRALQELKPADRFRIVTFHGDAHDLTGGFLQATPGNVAAGARIVERIGPEDCTNLYEGLRLGLSGLSPDRVTSLLLVTDAEANSGELRPAQFQQLARTHDFRFFGFLVGNSANWPLMETICRASGGFYAPVSRADDLVGQMLLAKSKIVHESIHDVSVEFTGVPVTQTTRVSRKIQRGQQLVLFGRYQRGGKAVLELKTRQSGREKAYRTEFSFPEVEARNPEIERLWATARIDDLELAKDVGELSEDESRQAITSLGLAYQLVTDHTSMVVLSDSAFAARGIERKNRERVAVETQAQAVRASSPVQTCQVDASRPAFPPPTSSGGGSWAPRLRGGGSLDPLSGLLVLGLGGLAMVSRRRAGPKTTRRAR